MNVCRQCKYLDTSVNYYGYCMRFAEVHIHPVDGRTQYINKRDPYEERNAGWFDSRVNNKCGKEGRFWEIKQIDAAKKWETN